MRKILIGVVLFTAALPLTARAKSAQEVTPTSVSESEIDLIRQDMRGKRLIDP
jgi:hypothetical protein